MSASRPSRSTARASSREMRGAEDCSRSPWARKLNPTEARGGLAAPGRLHVPQWIRLPTHATRLPAASGASGRAAARSKRTSIAPSASSSSGGNAGRMCAYAKRFRKWRSSGRGITIMHPLSGVTSFSGNHTLSTIGAPSPSRRDCRQVKSRCGIPKLDPAGRAATLVAFAATERSPADVLSAGGVEAIQQKTDGSMRQPSPSSASMGANTKSSSCHASSRQKTKTGGQPAARIASAAARSFARSGARSP